MTDDAPRQDARNPDVWWVPDPESDGAPPLRAITARASDGRVWVAMGGEIMDVAPPEAQRRTTRDGHDLSDIAAPMPGTVSRLFVQPGDGVTAGQTVLVLEAMKMELPLRAPVDGVVSAVHCAEGDLVQPGRTLVDVHVADTDTPETT